MQFRAAEYRQQLDAAQDSKHPVLCNRERSAAGMHMLREANVSAKYALELRNSVGASVELTLGRDALTAAAATAQKRRIWGDHRYTGDTDLLLALVHSGFVARSCLDASFAWPKRIEQLRAIVCVYDGQHNFVGIECNGMHSRAWPQPCGGFSFIVTRAWTVWRQVRNMLDRVDQIYVIQDCQHACCNASTCPLCNCDCLLCRTLQIEMAGAGRSRRCTATGPHPSGGQV